MKKYLPLLAGLVLLIFCLDLSGQQSGRNYRKMFDVNGYQLVNESAEGEASYISFKPATNREYIIYLCWLCNVYKDYPEVFMRAFPGIESVFLGSIVGEQFDIARDLPKLINAVEIARNYIFNTAFIDFPVSGITWNQSMNFMGWMTDRYNEMSLIKSKELNYDPNQSGESNFNTEAYICNQYEGVVRKLRIDSRTGELRRTIWSDKVYYPSFRLPSAGEVKLAGNSLKSDIVAYKPDRYLDYWGKLYILIRKDTLILKLGGYIENETRIHAPAGTRLPGFTSNVDEYTLDYGLNKKITGILDIYKEYGQDVIDEKTAGSYFTDQKNNLGLMPFIIIGEDRNSNPIFIKRAVYKRDTPSGKFTIFRFAMSAVK